MIEKGKISSFQMGMLMYPTIMATAVLILPAITIKHADRDMWISPIWGSLVGFALTYITYRLHKLYPGRSFIESSELVLGKIAGKCCGAVFLFMHFHDTGSVIREYGEFVIGNYLMRTPVTVVMGCLIIVAAFAVRGGLEVIARCAQLFVPLFSISVLLIILLLLPEYDPHHILPVMEEGIGRSLKGSLPVQSWFSDFVLLSFLLPALSDGNKGMKWGLIAVASIVVTMVITNIAILMLFGDLTVGYTYPFLVASRYIGLADFLEHLEAITMAVWVLVMFIKICMYYYVLVLGMAQLLKLPDYRPMVFPVGVCIVAMGIWTAPNLQTMAHFFGTSGLFYSLSVKALLPALICGVALMRHKIRSLPDFGGTKGGTGN